MDSPHLVWVKGGSARFVSIVDDAVVVRSTTSAPPGARLDATLASDPSTAVRIKVHGCKKEEDPPIFVIRGRLVDANRELRDRLAFTLRDA